MPEKKNTPEKATEIVIVAKNADSRVKPPTRLPQDEPLVRFMRYGRR